jgi:hypothetical protein
MPAIIIDSTVSVFHDPNTNTGGCRCSFQIDISGDVVSVTYDQDEIGLTAQNKITIDNLLTAIKNAAVVKLKADMANVILSASS